MKSKAFRFTELDIKELERVKSLMGEISDVEVIRRLLRNYGKTKNEVIDSEPEEDITKQLYGLVQHSVDYDTGDEFKLIKRLVKPFDTIKITPDHEWYDKY